MDTSIQTNAVQGIDPNSVQGRLRAKLSEYDLYALFDITGSMSGPVKASNPTGQTRWAYVQETARDLVKVACSIDDDGIILGFFGGNKFPLYENVTADKVDEILNAQNVGGGTYLAPALTQMFGKAGGTAKKDLIIVFLDGEVNDSEQTIAALVKQANSQTSDNDCTVLFIQVGDDKDATKFLTMLDDDLQKKYGAKFDIVDKKTVDEVNQFASFEELLAEAIIG